MFTPVGMALLGAQNGELAKITLPNGANKIMKVAEIMFQPEVSGDYTR